jgi:hypothetical protein
VMSGELQAQSLERPARTGWLWKQSQWVKKWTKRWFVLWPNAPSREKGRLLFYYLTPQDKRPRGVIPLAPGKFTLMTSAARTVKDVDFPVCLVIKLHNKRRESFLLATDNEKEVMAWAHAINATGAVDSDDLTPSAATDMVFSSSSMLRAQLESGGVYEDEDDGAGSADGGGGGGGGGARDEDDRAASGEIVDVLIQLDGELHALRSSAHRCGGYT